ISKCKFIGFSDNSINLNLRS
ncbi:unnamed protein product, partial [Callosobruchus maculatus]